MLPVSNAIEPLSSRSSMSTPLLSSFLVFYSPSVIFCNLPALDSPPITKAHWFPSFVQLVSESLADSGFPETVSIGLSMAFLFVFPSPKRHSFAPSFPCASLCRRFKPSSVRLTSSLSPVYPHRIPLACTSHPAPSRTSSLQVL